LTTPGWTMQYRSRVLTSSIRSMRVRDSTMPFPTGTDAPQRLVPAPRAVTGMPSRWATAMIAATALVDSGRRTSSGVVSATKAS
jgi:hypothetical protein